LHEDPWIFEAGKCLYGLGVKFICPPRVMRLRFVKYMCYYQVSEIRFGGSSDETSILYRKHIFVK